MSFFWLLIWSFFIVFYLMILFHIIGDLFRDKELSGWWKALWIIALIFVPFLSALIYLMVRGKGMAERQAGEMQKAQAATDSYIQEVAGRSNPAKPDSHCEEPARPRDNHADRVRPTQGGSARLTGSRLRVSPPGAMSWAPHYLQIARSPSLRNAQVTGLTEAERPPSADGVRPAADR